MQISYHDRSLSLYAELGFDVREAFESGDARVVERLGRITGYTAGFQCFAHSVAETNDDLGA